MTIRSRWLSLRAKHLIALWMYSVLALPLMAGESAQIPDFESIHGSIWRGPDGEPAGQTALLIRHLPSCVASVLYLQIRDSDLVVLVSDQKVREGEMRELFRDEASKWEIEVTVRTALRFENSKDALDSLKFVARAEQVLDEGATVTVRASNVEAITLTYETSQEFEQEPILDRLEDQGFASLLGRRSPKGTGELIREVRRMACDDSEVDLDGQVLDLLAMVDTMLRRHRPPGIELTKPSLPRQVLLEETTNIRLDMALSEDELTFLAQFPSFDPLRPMAGTCAENSAPKRLPAQPED